MTNEMGRCKDCLDTKRLLDSIRLSISYHNKNTNDPHGVSMAVLTALIEVEGAVLKAIDHDNKTDGSE